MCLSRAGRKEHLQQMRACVYEWDRMVRAGGYLVIAEWALLATNDVTEPQKQPTRPSRLANTRALAAAQRAAISSGLASRLAVALLSREEPAQASRMPAGRRSPPAKPATTR